MPGSDPASVIETERLRLVPLDVEVLSAFARRDPECAASLMQVHIDANHTPDADLAQMRLAQLSAEPGLRNWLLRVIIRVCDDKMVGHIGFHSQPDPDYLRETAPGAVELGYTVYAPYRRMGYAYEAAVGLMEWAMAEYAVTGFVASVSPENTASLALVDKLGFHKISRHIDPIDGIEDVYLLPRFRCRSDHAPIDWDHPPNL